MTLPQITALLVSTVSLVYFSGVDDKNVRRQVFSYYSGDGKQANI